MMKWSASFGLISLLIAATQLASCSVVRTMAQQHTRQRALLEAYAGRPVGQTGFLAVRPGAVTISDNQLVTWTDFTQTHAYLITVGSGCPNLYLSRAVLVTSLGDVVRADSDHVFAQGYVCPIKTIQPVDYLKVQHELWRGRNTLPGDAAIRG
jgi:Family of unknown function (DUF6491)